MTSMGYTIVALAPFVSSGFLFLRWKMAPHQMHNHYKWSDMMFYMDSMQYI